MGISFTFRRTNPAGWIIPCRRDFQPICRLRGGRIFPLITSAPAVVPDVAGELACYADIGARIGAGARSGAAVGFLHTSESVVLPVLDL